MNLCIIAGGVVTLALLLGGCQPTNKPVKPGDTSAEKINFPVEKSDSLFGFQGCDKGRYRADSIGSFELVYSDYRVQVKTPSFGQGQEIVFIVDSTGLRLPVPPLEEGGYFRGKWRNFFFVDLGTNPDLRKLNVYKEDKGGLYQVFQTEYLPYEAPVVSSSGSLWFYAPIEEAAVREKPYCPDAEEWRKQDLSIGYGQRQLFDMTQRMLVRKSEYICVPRR